MKHHDRAAAVQKMRAMANKPGLTPDLRKKLRKGAGELGALKLPVPNSHPAVERARTLLEQGAQLMGISPTDARALAK